MKCVFLLFAFCSCLPVYAMIGDPDVDRQLLKAYKKGQLSLGKVSRNGLADLTDVLMVEYQEGNLTVKQKVENLDTLTRVMCATTCIGPMRRSCKKHNFNMFLVAPPLFRKTN